MLRIQVHETEWRILLKREKNRILCLQLAFGFHRHLNPQKNLRLLQTCIVLLYLFTI